MTDTNQMNEIDQDLVDKVVSLIPEHTWDEVKATLITHIVDSMPSEVLIRLTNDAEGFEQAEEILYNYYENPERYWNLINDSFQLFGDEYVLTLLDSMQLNKIQPENNEC
jgi:hypothetical protein